MYLKKRNKIMDNLRNVKFSEINLSDTFFNSLKGSISSKSFGVIVLKIAISDLKIGSEKKLQRARKHLYTWRMAVSSTSSI